MRAVSIDWIQKWTGADPISTVARDFTGVGTDTRADLTGQIFLALKGDAFDAHAFAAAAIQKGAVGLLVHEVTAEIADLAKKVTVLKVNDTLKALQQMGLGARRESKVRILALTGSNGKTTTKEFTATILSETLNVHWSKGSFNNHWGVPFSLLQLRPEHEAAVIEVGMNHAGEIADLMKIIEPDVVLCTTVGRAHIEFFGSEEKVAEAKEEIYAFAPVAAKMGFNLDNPWTAKMHGKYAAEKTAADLFTFSGEREARVQLRVSGMALRHLEIEGSIDGVARKIQVPVFGAHNVINLMAAATLSLAAGLKPEKIWSGLEKCSTTWGRNQFIALAGGAEMIFDAYNANPDSMQALLENIRVIEPSRRRIGVFGQMKELGAHAQEMHENLGEKVAAGGFAEIFFVGEDRASFLKGLERGGYRGPVHSADVFAPEVGQELKGVLKSGDIVVVKGSRGAKLEQFIEPCEPLGNEWKKK